MSRVAVYLVEDYSQRAEKLGAGPRGERETCEGELGGLCGENKWQDRRSERSEEEALQIR